MTLGDELREALGNRRLSHPRFSDVNRVVLETAAEDLDRPREDLLPADERIHLAGLRPGGQLRCVGSEKLVLILFVLPDRIPLPRSRARPLFACPAGEDRDAVRDVIEEDHPGDSFPLEEEGGVGFPFFKEGNEDIP